MFTALVTQHVKRFPHIIFRLLPLWLYHIFYSTSESASLGEKIYWAKNVSVFLYDFFSEVLHMLRRIHRVIIMPVHMSSFKVLVILARY